MTEAQSPRPTTDDIVAEYSEYWSSEGFELFDSLSDNPTANSQSGVGKSSLINHAFGIDLATVAHEQRGTCNIEDEIISKHNEYFVLHDSMGFEPGKTEEFERAKEFFKSRGKKVPLRDRVHVIWLCIKVPHAGSRVFETGDEEFLKLAASAKVPVVVVFTQFDILHSRMERALTDEEMKMPADQIQRLCSERAENEFKNTCLPSLRNMDPTPRHARTFVHLHRTGRTKKSGPDLVNSSPHHRALDDLISTTLQLLEETSSFVGKILMNAQNRRAVQSLMTGMKSNFVAVLCEEFLTSFAVEYWRGIASSTKFPGFKLEKCLNTLHIDIVTAWNFSDPNKLFRSNEFVEQMRTITQIVVPREEEVTDWLRSPETLRLFMGYIIDLTLVLDQLFVIVLALGPPNLLTQTDIDAALDKYTSGAAKTVHAKSGVL
ncbi:hypothetical protein C8R45DRAFT_1111525 [Mycena sanguinolenta]|nr:hypothetical protein C8R45DRAFT_1111525 [Mycena sanguinolenta]